MIRQVYFIFTLLFWLAVASFWGASLWLPAKPVAATPAPGGRYTLADVAHHDSLNDCWIAIGGQVYDLTDYVQQHPTSPDVILRWCGKEGTNAFDTKERGRPHSPYASELLQKYHIGELQ